VGDLKVLFVSPEVYPLAKVGGLADVAYALPKALRGIGHDARIVMPQYGWIKDGYKKILDIAVPFQNAREEVVVKKGNVGEVPVYFLENQTYFDVQTVYTNDRENLLRFSFFSKAVVEMLKHIDFKPDIVHCNDWHNGLVPVNLGILRKDVPRFREVATVFTIHNLKYQGTCPGITLTDVGLPDSYKDLLEHELVNPMKGGILYSDLVSAVSKTYAKEIQTPEYGCGLDSYLRTRGEVCGVVNGIDYNVWDPKKDKFIHQKYDASSPERKLENKLYLLKEISLPADPEIPLLGMVSRLDVHKGIDLVVELLPKILKSGEINFVLLGSADPKYGGDPRYHVILKDIDRDFVNARVFLKFDEKLAHKIYAGSDIFLMPSLFEPCGLGQLIALRYGTIPVVRRTGGLADTIIDFDGDKKRGNGFVFGEPTGIALERAVRRVLAVYRRKEVWRGLVERAMGADHSWERSAREYVELYHKARMGEQAYGTGKGASE
jgi:starch synthase